MNWHEVVFSETTRLRRQRHIFFWLAWLFYFVSTFFYKQQVVSDGVSLIWVILVLVKAILLLAGHVLLCYVTLYFLLPNFLLLGRYLSFISIWLGTSIVVTAWTYLCYDQFFPLLDTYLNHSVHSNNHLLWNSFFAGPLSACKLVAVAIIIKLLKRWWEKQKENLRLEREKVEVELQLLKAQIHPEFLFSSLDKLYEYARTDLDTASALLLKLSDLLSYMLYECNKKFVPLLNEIQMVRDYLELEKKRLGRKFDIDLQVKGPLTNKMIAPLLLLPFIENAISFCEDKNLEQCWLNVDIRAVDNTFSLKLINGKSPSVESSTTAAQSRLDSVNKRLGLIYPNGYESKLTIEPDFMISFLRIHLERAPMTVSPGPVLNPIKQNLFTYASNKEN